MSNININIINNNININIALLDIIQKLQYFIKIFFKYLKNVKIVQLFIRFYIY